MAIKFEQIHSGSTGNLYIVTANNEKQLILECGVTWPNIRKALNCPLCNIVACFLTHEHQDHSKAANDVIKNCINVYASAGTFNALGLSVSEYWQVHAIRDKDLIRLDTFDVLVFKANHDAVEPLGFVVREKETNQFLLFATDTSHITQRFKVAFSIIAIECSYDRAILEDRLYTQQEDLEKRGLTKVNEELAKRLLGSHMEKQNTIRYLSDFCDISKCQEIHLLHMSSENIEKEQTRKEIEERFFITTIIKD